MKKLYVCTQGLYADYSINAVFDDEDVAKRFTELFDDPDNIESNIEVWELNPHAEEIKLGYLPYTVFMNPDGEVESVYIQKSACLFMDEDRFIYANLVHNCFASSSSHAIALTKMRCDNLIHRGLWEINKE